MVARDKFIAEVYPPIVLIGYAIVFAVFAIAKRNEFSLAPKIGGWLLPIGSLYSILVGFFGTILPLASIQGISAILILLGALGLFGSSMGQKNALRVFTLLSMALLLVSVGMGDIFADPLPSVAPWSFINDGACDKPDSDLCKGDGYLAFFRIISHVWIFVNGMSMISAAEASDIMELFNLNK